MDFRLKTEYLPSGDQPQAIKKIVDNINASVKYQTLLGITGSGKTFTMASVIEKTQRPALIISHNKTLAAQLYQEFKEFFPENSIHYFVSYYDYYQPEAYLPSSDTYIEKDSKINNFIDQLRHASTQAALTRNDLIIVASVSCIYGIGDPREYENMAFKIKTGQTVKRQDLLQNLVLLQYERNDIESPHGTFAVKGETVDIVSPDGDTIIRIGFYADVIESITELKNTIEHETKNKVGQIKIFPAKHFVSPKEKQTDAVKNIKFELKERLRELKKAGKLLEAQRLEQKTDFDMEMLEKTGYVNGIENYSRHLSFREPGSPPFTLLDYLPKNTIIFIDESHMTIPQIRGMHAGDRSRKQTLVDYGFRLPSALDNRPLKFEEFENKISSAVFVSATPSNFEFEASGGQVTEQLIRPTGLLDPRIEIRPAKDQIKDIIGEIKKSAMKKERVLLTTLTKRLAEEITDHLIKHDIKAEYVHSEIKTIERSKTLKRLREGDFDVLVGINLLREGLDLPEVGLVLILDADKEGFLRNKISFIQTIGRAARNPNGRAILYADIYTRSIKEAVEETERRRKIQIKYNQKNNIIPKPVKKEIRKPFWIEEKKEKAPVMLKNLFRELGGWDKVKDELERQMLECADDLEFEKAARLRDIIKTIQ
ncbi:MAG: excinuclease ABC subunit B [Candidatus Niyogibacteria bacterium CG10_big_fil_rev_8_21_14_0_10_42_19]|uniref:UvrABC system protein B n=1 Tax=Candidatus Niyogibacteria bacterium CG10_big_fil_rev_8_21_14_0_10_42_19 TaxID=1974725 RepID=A0A2H0TF28_9BACT|nr:MAG: excinuclease ABC subunit B [Candidatus Niyogibacteria bacterium CG10_big_fil_rev_8_21_14_0_10_42_19]